MDACIAKLHYTLMDLGPTEKGGNWAVDILELSYIMVRIYVKHVEI